MVRVCLYLALALGLAGSGADAAACAAVTVPTSTVQKYMVTGTADYSAGAANVGKNCAALGATATVDQGEYCNVKCATGHYMTHPHRDPTNEDQGMVICADAATAAPTLPTCTACETVDNEVASATYTCTNAKDSEVSACVAGFYKTSAVTGKTPSKCEAYTSHKNCDVDLDGANHANGIWNCKTPATGYKKGATASSAPVKCVADATFGMATWNTRDNTPAITGITCTETGTTVRIPSCPDGTFHTAGTGTTDDTCTACFESGNSRCSCTKAAAVGCLASGSCKENYWTYVGDGAGKAPTSKSCKACTKCGGSATVGDQTCASTSTKLGQVRTAYCTSTSDVVYADCDDATTNGKKTGITCDSLKKTNQNCEAGMTNSGDAAAKTKADLCAKETCTCPAKSYINADKSCDACTETKVVGTAVGSAGTNIATACTATADGTVLACAGTGDPAGCTPGTAATITTPDNAGKYIDSAGCTATVKGTCTSTGAACVDGTSGRRTQGVVFATGAAGTETYGNAHTCLTPTKSLTFKSFVSKPVNLILTSTDLDWDGAKDKVSVHTGTSCTEATEAAGGSPVLCAPCTAIDTDGCTAVDKKKCKVTFADISEGAATLIVCADVAGLGFDTSAGTAGDGDKYLIKVGTLTHAAAVACVKQNTGFPKGCSYTDTDHNGDVSATSVSGYNPQTKAGYTAACTVSCGTAGAGVTVTDTAATACTAQVGCKSTSTVTTCLTGKTVLGCDAKEAGYTIDNQAVYACFGAGQSTLDKDGSAESCSNACWYMAKCKTGYTMTEGVGVTNTCASDSAASLSLTAVLLSVVAKIFLF